MATDERRDLASPLSTAGMRPLHPVAVVAAAPRWPWRGGCVRRAGFADGGRWRPAVPWVSDVPIVPSADESQLPPVVVNLGRRIERTAGIFAVNGSGSARHQC